MDLVQQELKRGKKNARSARNIANATNLRSDKTDTLIRTIITELIMSRSVPVGSCSQGFYIITNTDELKEVLFNLRKRATGITHRLGKIKRNFAHSPPT